MRRSFIAAFVVAFVLAATSFAHALQKRWIYVGGKDRTLSTFEVDAAGGLTAVDALALAGRVRDLAIYRDSQGFARWLYAVLVDTSIGATVAVFAIDPEHGTLTLLEEHPVADGATSTVLARPVGTTYLYVAHEDAGAMEAFRINPGTGGLTPLLTATYPADAGVRCLTTDAGGKFLYATSDGPLGPLIRGWTVAGATGELTEIAGSPWDAGSQGDGAWCFQPTPAIGRYWGWVTETASNRMTKYDIDPMTGALTIGPTIGDEMDAPTYVAYTTASTFAYVVNLTGTIAAFATNVGDGTVTPIGTYSTDANSPPEKVVVTSGNVFVANLDSIVVFDVRVTGELVPVPGSPFPTGGVASAIAMARTQY